MTEPSSGPRRFFKKIRIPFYTGSGAYAYTYKLHWLGAQHYFQNIDASKKLHFHRTGASRETIPPTPRRDHPLV